MSLYPLKVVFAISQMNQMENKWDDGNVSVKTNKDQVELFVGYVPKTFIVIDKLTKTAIFKRQPWWFNELKGFSLINSKGEVIMIDKATLKEMNVRNIMTHQTKTIPLFTKKSMEEVIVNIDRMFD